MDDIKKWTTPSIFKSDEEMEENYTAAVRFIRALLKDHRERGAISNFNYYADLYSFNTCEGLERYKLFFMQCFINKEEEEPTDTTFNSEEWLKQHRLPSAVEEKEEDKKYEVKQIQTLSDKITIKGIDGSNIVISPYADETEHGFKIEHNFQNARWAYDLHGIFAALTLTNKR